MSDTLRILTINPGSTSTGVAVFEEASPLAQARLDHTGQHVGRRGDLWNELGARRKDILAFLADRDIPLESLDAIVGRGGLLRPVAGGTYEVNQTMLHDARAHRQGAHPSNLGCALASEIAEAAGVAAYVVDPVSTDEFNDLAYFSGLAGVRRRSLAHALSIHAVARVVADRIGRHPARFHAVVAHLGRGISVCPVSGGRILDANNANSDGPFSPQRCGGLPVQDLIELCFSGEYSRHEMIEMTTRRGGLSSYLGTDSATEIERRINEGDEEALTAYLAMAYQVAKEIGAMATVLGGQVDAVILTGDLASSSQFTSWVKQRVSFIAPVHIVPEAAEMAAMAAGVLDILHGESRPLIY